MLFYNAAGMQVTDDMHTHNCINTIQKLCFCYILFFLFFGGGIAVNAFLQKLLDDIVLVFYWNICFRHAHHNLGSISSSTQ